MCDVVREDIFGLFGLFFLARSVLFLFLFFFSFFSCFLCFNWKVVRLHVCFFKEIKITLFGLRLIKEDYHHNCLYDV